MPSPFDPLAAQLKAVERKLTLTCYQALFAPEPSERAHSLACATELNKTLETLLNTAYDSAEQVTRFAHSPTLGSSLRSAQELVLLIEQGHPHPLSKMSSGSMPSCAATPQPLPAVS